MVSAEERLQSRAVKLRGAVVEGNVWLLQLGHFPPSTKVLAFGKEPMGNDILNDILNTDDDFFG